MIPSSFIPISGRPNAGKTSLINYLTHSKRPVGKRPGTTIRITPVPLIRDIFLVDLPGFGRITKRSKEIEEQVKDEIVQYFDDPSKSLVIAIHVIDVSTFHLMVENLERKGIIPIDIEMIRFIAESSERPPLVVFNKIDKVKKELLATNVQLLESYRLPPIQLFLLSLKTKEGCRILRNTLKNIIVEKFGQKYKQW
jgi:GTP-binding protein EngB required for normal cell division